MSECGSLPKASKPPSSSKRSAASAAISSRATTSPNQAPPSSRSPSPPERLSPGSSAARLGGTRRWRAVWTPAVAYRDEREGLRARLEASEQRLRETEIALAQANQRAAAAERVIESPDAQG